MDDDTMQDRRKRDEAFKAQVIGDLDRIKRTLFDEEGNSNIRIMQRQQISLHRDNTARIDGMDARQNKFERALFDEEGNSRLRRLEIGVNQILETFGKGRFLGTILIGAGAIIGPALGAFITWFFTRKL